jgi:hypothetical protein
MAGESVRLKRLKPPKRQFWAIQTKRSKGCAHHFCPSDSFCSAEFFWSLPILHFPWSFSVREKSGEGAEGQHGVQTAEGEGLGEGCFCLFGAGLVGNHVQVTFGIWLGVVHRGGQHSVA